MKHFSALIRRQHGITRDVSQMTIEIHALSLADADREARLRVAALNAASDHYFDLVAVSEIL